MSDPSWTFVGVDPGLVHTGVVELELDLNSKRIAVTSHVLDDAWKEHPKQLQDLLSLDVDHIYIESYRERGHNYGTNMPMRALLTLFRSEFPKATILDNTGSKKVIRPQLLELLKLKKFPTTHHQDLQAAARILVYGMLKNPEHNTILTRVVHDTLEGNPWTSIPPKHRRTP